MRPALRRVATGSTVLALTVVVPATSYLMLRSDGPLPAPLLYGVLVLSACTVRRLTTGSLRLWAGVVTALLLPIGAAVIVTGLNITPASSFASWLKLVSSGQEEGTISFLFVLVLEWIGTVACGYFIAGKPAEAVIGYIAAAGLVWGAILGSPYVAGGGAVAFVAWIGYRALRPFARRRAKALIAPLGALFLASALGALLAQSAPRNALFDLPFRVNLAGSVARLFPAFPLLYGLPGYGYSFPNSAMGGRPALTSRPVFRVEGSPGETIYLRTAGFDRYTGHGWDQSPETRRELLPGGVGRPLRVTVLADLFDELPETLDTISALRASPGGISSELSPAAFGRSASFQAGFPLNDPLSRGEVIVDDRAATSRAVAEPTPSDLDTSGVPADVVALAHAIGAGRGQSEIPNSIREYLLDHYVYTLETAPAPADSDAVADFLFHERKGYCVQFASAFVVLARLNGLPARYVTGFLVNLPAGRNSTVVTGLSAHAWAETWSNDGGWTTQEATPPMVATSDGWEDYFRRYAADGSPLTARELVGIMGPRLPPRTVLPTPHLLVNVPEIEETAGAVALACAAFFFIRLFLRSPERQIRDIARRLASLRQGFASLPPSTVGWRNWAAQRSPLASRSLAPAARLIQRIVFGGRPITKRDLHYLRAVRRRARRRSFESRRHFTSPSAFVRVSL